METAVLNFLVVFGITVVTFMLLRQVNLWYWKINKRIELMEEQNKLLRKLVNTSSPENSDSQNFTLAETKWKCDKCNNLNPNSTYKCEKCGYKIV